MNTKPIIVAVFFVLALSVASADAAQRSRGPAGQSGAVGRAVPRAVYPSRVIRPRVIIPYRPFVYRPRVAFSFAYGYPFGYRYPYFYGYPYGYYGSLYGYPGYGYGLSAYGPYRYGYRGYGYSGLSAYGPYRYGYRGYGYGGPYGAVRITDAPHDAQVYVDGYYAGIVDDFDGVFQHLNLEPGPHRIEIRAAGAPPVAVDVNVEPGETITYHARVP